MKKIIITVSIAAAVCVGYSVLRAESTSTREPSPDTHMAGRYISQDDFTRTAEQTVNGVVSVKSYATPRRQQQRQYDPYSSDPFFDFFFGSPRGQRVDPRQPQQTPRQQQIGLGSGVIISEDGYIVTNNHVVADAERLEVTLNDNRNYDATVIGTDPSTDLALVKIDAPDLHVIPMGNSENLRVGEWVLAVGNPFGFTSSVTSGIVSAKARNISHATGVPSNGIESYIQTDAALNSGNSGGALVNLDGELVGINTAIYSQTGTYAGCSFAIPTSIVRKVISDIKTYGVVQRAYLGIAFSEVTPELVSAKDIKGTTSGIYVAGVEDRSAAREAGLEEGDVIVALNDHPVRSGADMQEAITTFSPGDEVRITFWRNGSKKTSSVTLRNSRGDTSLTRAESDNPLGATLTSINADTARRLEISGGVEVTEIEADGRFATAGIRKGFIIRTINGARITKPEEVMSIYRALGSAPSSQDRVMFITGLYSSGKAAYYAVPIDD